MSNKDIIVEYRHQIQDLVNEKTELTKLVDAKDAKIKKILVLLEQSNEDVQNLGKKIAELEGKLKKKSSIKRVLDKKITEILENTSENEQKKDDESVDKEGDDVL